jgi:hypothetical protein
LILTYFFQIQESLGLVQKLGPIEHAYCPNVEDFIDTKFKNKLKLKFI